MNYGLDVSITGAYAQVALLADLAALAEDAGWDGFFVQDCLLPGKGEAVVDPWLALCAIALATKRLRIGAFMTPLAAYRPWQLARLGVTLDHLSGGRLIFGAGLGFQADDFLTVGEDATASARAEKLDESLALLRLFWKGEPFSFAGKHYQMRQAQLLPTPVQTPTIPIWLAGTWPHRKPLRRAAGFDGIYIASQRASGEPLTPTDLHEALTYLQSQRQETTSFDVAFAGETEAATAADVIEPYAQAGATWWLEGIWVERGAVEQMRERIRYGPPKRHA
ncbi:MAG TPA: LLM class flavin-dependent oxidoreductase [Ktedonobacterales bacterium]|nr:LLM class flavin-dependent oxidoreductase [Ktedonobacterales bacterium]